MVKIQVAVLGLSEYAGSNTTGSSENKATRSGGGMGPRAFGQDHMLRIGAVSITTVASITFVTVQGSEKRIAMTTTASRKSPAGIVKRFV
jgi:hypothetical protein